MQALKTYIVEDNPVIRDNLITTLEELAPVQVLGTADGEFTALKWLNEADLGVDLLIVDLFLKNGSGLGLLKAVQTLSGLRRVVVLSNYATTDIRRKCLELGAHRVFDKSNEIDALMEYCKALAASEDGDEDGATNPAAPP